ncbi:hypothetical protein ColLi_05650 [Colletotrichum liriopes]|uniref:Bulb-type lectin domain-containing protein n=1 Tax=Colletotrichum liriopes TaxID=708192 RepID=A0AA37LSJ1_9PEZI|nr:hypothetical protein ColLi_05650 [Colletotrichum liriopes]
MGPTHGPGMTTSQSRWVRIGGSTSRRSKVVFGALILFLASSVFVLQPDWHVSSSGLRVPSLHRQPSSGPTASPPTENSPAPQKSAEDGGSSPRSAVLSPDADGVLLSAGTPFFSSPSGRYSLILQDDGDLVLNRMDEDGTAHPVWWTGTGDKHSGGRTLVVEKTRDHFRIVLNAMLKNTWTVVWHSDLDPACKIKNGAIIQRDEDGNQPQSTGMLEMDPGQLELSDQGRLSIAGLCDLYVSPKEREKERTLAVIIAGLYRTNHMTCKTHMDNLVADHPSFSRIDVFAYVLFEPADVNVFNRSKESIEAELRECYGSHLRSVDVLPVAQEEEEYPGGKKAMEATPCGKKLRRLNNQLKTVRLAAERWWAWSIANGFTHDTVLRIRPDTSLRAAPEFRSLEELGQNTLVLPHPHGEHYFYCARMCGRVGVGPTDQIAYGSAAAMGHWLYMYDRFQQMVELAGSPSGPALHDFSGCEVLPPGPLASDCPKPAPCSIECLVAWFLDARGVEFHIEWGWEQNLLRWIDLGPLGAEEERQADYDMGVDERDDGLAWG